MRPDWMKCEACLFYTERPIEDDDPRRHHNCMRSPRPIGTTPKSFCGSWTCRRCLQPWRYPNIEYYSPERTSGWEYFEFNNHFECVERCETHHDVEQILNE